MRTFLLFSSVLLISIMSFFKNNFFISINLHFLKHVWLIDWLWAKSDCFLALWICSNECISSHCPAFFWNFVLDLFGFFLVFFGFFFAFFLDFFGFFWIFFGFFLDFFWIFLDFFGFFWIFFGFFLDFFWIFSGFFWIFSDFFWFFLDFLKIGKPFESPSSFSRHPYKPRPFRRSFRAAT